MNQESATTSLTAPFYVTFTFLHLGFHIIEMVNNSNIENNTQFNYSENDVLSGKFGYSR